MSGLLGGWRIEDESSCNAAIRAGAIAAVISAFVTAVFAIAGFFVEQDQASEWRFLLDPWSLLDVALGLGLAAGVIRRSRVAATILVAYFLISKIVVWVALGKPVGLWIAILFLGLYANAARATYIWHASYRPAGTPSTGEAKRGIAGHLRRSVSFSGRSGRAGFWKFILWNIAATALMTLGAIGMDATAQADAGRAGLGLVITLQFLVMLVPGVAFIVRRFHDQDKSGWFVLLGLVPFFGFVILLAFMCAGGTQGSNRFGPAPSTESTAINRAPAAAGESPMIV